MLDTVSVSIDSGNLAFISLEYTPSTSEIDAWMDYLEGNPTLAGASHFIHAAFDGPGYRAIPVALWDYVTTLYQAILGRSSTPEEVTPWVNDLLARFNIVLPLFVNSAEYQSLVPNCQDPNVAMALVTRLYQQALGRTPSQAEVDPWTNYIVATCDLEGTIRLFFNSNPAPSSAPYMAPGWLPKATEATPFGTTASARSMRGFAGFSHTPRRPPCPSP